MDMLECNCNKYYGEDNMNNNYKNLGVALGLSALVDGLSLTKFHIPSVGSTVYLLSSDDESIKYSINTGDEDFADCSEDILKAVLEYTYRNLTGTNARMRVNDEQSQNSNITLIANLLKRQARICLEEIDRNRYTDIRSEGEYQMNQIEGSIEEFTDSLYMETREGTPDYEIFEYAQTLLETIYGTYPLDRDTINRDCSVEEWEECVEKAGEFLDRMNDYADENIFDMEYFADDSQGIREYEDSDELTPEEQAELDYMAYKQAKEDFLNGQSKDKDNKDTGKKKFSGKGTSQSPNYNRIIRDYAEERYLDRMGELFGLKDKTFLRKLAEKAHKLFGEENIPDDKLANLAELLADQMDEREFDDLDGMEDSDEMDR